MTKQRPKSRSDLHWKKRRQIPDQQIVDAADQYQKASELLNEEPAFSGILLPLVNTAAVSIELYLKSLNAERIYTPDKQNPEVSLVSSYPEKAGHSLSDLFDGIDQKLRDQMTAAYDARLRPELKKDLKTTLKKMEGAFSVSRYSFEPHADITKYKPFYLLGLARFLRDFVKSLPVREQVER